MRRLVGSLFAVVLATFAPNSVRAFVDVPVLDPPLPVEGQLISITLRAGACDVIILPSDQFRQLDVTGDLVRVTVPHIRNIPPIPCLTPTHTVRTSIGVLPAGSYRLQVYGLSPSQPNGTPALLTSTQFQVGPTVVVPISSPSGLLVLAGLLLLVGMGRSALRRS